MLPDERWNTFIEYNLQTSKRKRLTFEEDFYKVAMSLKLNENVPKEISRHFSTALNLLIYSWYYYPFNVTAEFHASITVEMALKSKFKNKDKKPKSFKGLMEKAVSKGMVKNDEYTELFINNIVSIRNIYAHGSNMLHHSGESTVRRSADFINQLFDEASKTKP